MSGRRPQGGFRFKKGPAQRKPAIVDDEEIDEDGAFTAEDIKLYGDLGSIKYSGETGKEGGYSYDEEDDANVSDHEPVRRTYSDDDSDDDGLGDEPEDDPEEVDELMGMLTGNQGRRKDNLKDLQLPEPDSEDEDEDEVSEEDFDGEAGHERLLQQLSAASKVKRGAKGSAPASTEERMEENPFGVSAGARLSLEDLIGGSFGAAEGEAEAEPKKKKGSKSELEAKLARKALRGLLDETSDAAELARQVPAADHDRARMERQAAYQSNRADLTRRWQQKVTRDRRAETLHFEAPRQQPENLAGLQAKFTPSTSFERDLEALLGDYGLAPDRKRSAAQDEDEDGDGDGTGRRRRSDRLTLEAEEIAGRTGLSLEQVRERQAEVAQLRAVMFHHELKNKQISKIKSKKFRAVARKTKEKALNKILEDPNADPELLRARQEKLELQRIEERMTLAHRNKGKWVQRQLRRGGQNTDSEKNAIHEQLELHRQLKQKISHMGGADDGARDSSGDELEDRMSDSEAEDEDAQLDRLKKELQDGPAELKDRKGIFALKFMQRAMKRQAAETLEDLEAEDAELRGEPLQEPESAPQQQGRRLVGASINGLSAEELRRQQNRALEEDDDEDDEEEEDGEEAGGEDSRRKVLMEQGSLQSVSRALGRGQLASSNGALTVGDEDQGDDSEVEAEEEEEKDEATKATELQKKQKKKSSNRSKRKKLADEDASSSEEETEEVVRVVGGKKSSNPGAGGESLEFSSTLYSATSASERPKIPATTSQKLGQETGKKGKNKRKAPEDEGEGGLASELDISRLEQDPGSARKRKASQGAGAEAGSNKRQKGEDGAPDAVQRALVKQAFTDFGDELENEFLAERAQALDEELPEELRESNILKAVGRDGKALLPGWGDWAGEGVVPKKKSAAQLRLEKQAETARLKKRQRLLAHRQDAKLAHVIKSEKGDRKSVKYLAPTLPHPYSSPEQLEQTLRMPIGRDWNTHSSFQRNVKPGLIHTDGHIITPAQFKKPRSHSKK